jgi:hypothetical protein
MMRLASQTRADILRRIAELEAEMRRARHDLKNLGAKDTAIAEVVIRGAQLSRERSNLERRLEAIRLTSPDAAISSSQAKVRHE